jgi:PAS domain S-box-containing protein
MDFQGILSIVLPVVICLVGLLLISYFRKGTLSWTRKLATAAATAAAMGPAILVMHYTGMAAVTFIATRLTPDLSQSVDISALASFGIVIVTFVILGFVVIRSLVDRRLSVQQSIWDDERNRLRALIDNIPDFMYVKDKQSRFVIANAHTARVLGANSAEELLGRTDFDFFPPELASAFRADEQQVMRSGQPLYNREEEGIDSAGNETYVLTTKVPIRDRNGQITGVAGVGRDISERKKSEDALREGERSYREIFDEAIIGMFQSTPEGRFVNVNRAMAGIFGFDSPEEMVASVDNISRQLYVDPKRHHEFRTVMDRLGSMLSLESEVYRKDGSKIWIASSGRAVRKNRVVVRYEGMAEDITERKMLRNQLLQAQKLESVGQLAAGIAHEINTPTQYIGDNVRFLKDSFTGLKGLLVDYERLLVAAKNNALSGETVREIEAAVERADTSYLLEEIPKAIEQTLEGVNRVSTLVSAMKEFSHPGTKEKVPLDLNHAIESTVAVSRNEWKYVADLQTDFDRALPLIPCQAGEFNQVILNLIVNAAHAIGDVVGKAGSAKGRICVQTRDCPDWVEIRIQDNGSGIPEHVRPRIFDPFFTTKEIGKGTGQGLAITRSVVVDKYGGTVHFETEEGKGTTFIIRLPHDGKALTVKAASA